MRLKECAVADYAIFFKAVIIICTKPRHFSHLPITFMTLNTELLFTFSPLHRLQWEEAQQKTVILYPEGMVELNQSSAEILKLCDGTRTLLQIVEELETKFAASNLTNDVSAFLEVALKSGWITQR